MKNNKGIQPLGWKFDRFTRRMSLLVAFMLVGINVTPALAASSIEITGVDPEGCIEPGQQITISGSATADAPPGNLDQYAVDVDWDDGTIETIIQQGEFGNGKGTSTLSFTATHTYANAGTYEIAAEIYHQNPQGRDNPDATIALIEICVAPPDPTYSISGTKFNDVDNDGSVEGDSGIQGWTIYIDQNDNNSFDSGEPFQVTDENGDYIFEGLTMGETYVIREDLQSGWTQTYPGANSGDEWEVLLGDVNETGKDFGNFQTPEPPIDPCVLIDGGCTISGIKFNDIDNNGVYDDSIDTLLSGWTIYIDANANGTLDDGETSVVTDTSGMYTLGNLTSGTYVVREEMEAGWDQTLPGALDDFEYSVVINGASEVGVNFGNHEDETVCRDGSISGFIFNDANGNETWDEGESVLSDWEVYLDLNNDGSLDEGEPTDVTDETGAYSLTGLLDGTYVVRQVLQNGWNQTYPGSVDGFSHELTLTCPDEEPLLELLQFFIAAIVDNIATDVNFGNQAITNNNGGGGGGGGTPNNPTPDTGDTAGDNIIVPPVNTTPPGVDPGEVLADTLPATGFPVSGVQVLLWTLMTMGVRSYQLAGSKRKK